MADDLGVNWWEDGKVKEEEEKKNDGEAIADGSEKVRSGKKRKSCDKVLETERKNVDDKKRKRKRKRITEEKLPEEGGDGESLTKALRMHFNKLSSLELEELRLEDKHFASCNTEKDHTISSYLKQVLPKWHRISTDYSHKMSPLILVVTGNALRACHLNKDAQSFKGKCRSLKLFSRHMKIDEQIKALNNSVSHFAVGTPERLKALIQQGALSLSHTRIVVIDWNWRDIKMKTIVDVPQVKQSLMNLLKDCVIPACKKGSVKIGLF